MVFSPKTAEKLKDGKLLIYSRNGVWQARVYIGKRRYLWLGVG